MTEQNTFLSHIRSELGFSPSQERGAEQCPPLFKATDIGEVLDRIEGRSARARDELLEVFRESAALINLNVHNARGFGEAGEVIAEIIRTSTPEFDTAHQIVQHDHDDIAALELSTRLDDGMILNTTKVTDHEIREKTIASFIGITAPSWGVADSATVLQITGVGKPRSTSLVPAIHIALLRRENMLADLTELYAVMRRAPNASSSVFISGPSKTADIESRLVHGAHGPREMHVVVVDVSGE